MQRFVSRKAASTARSRIEASARSTANYESESESEVEEPTRKKPKTNDRERVHQNTTNRLPEWYIAIDFGTTFTTVAWYKRGTPIEHIYTIDNFPGEKRYDQTGRQIPTEVWYAVKNARAAGRVKPHDIRMRFGNEVHRMIEHDEGGDIRRLYDDEDRVTMMKLMLDKTAYAQASKERLQDTLGLIKVKGHIDEDEDVLFHFFREVFRASKSRLGHEFNSESIVEVTVCVPVCYSPAAVAITSAQVERAMKEMRFGTDGESPCNIFVVHEAEAQAMQALKESLGFLEQGEVFILIDCGGGTTDIGIYRIASTDPPRLGSEVYEPMGAMVGAGDLNARFRTLVKDILRKELYLEKAGESIDTIVDAETMYEFENKIKRVFQYNDTEAEYSIRILGLKKNRYDERIRDNYLVLTYRDIWNVFRPSVKKIGNMMEDAIVNAKTVGYNVSKIVVVGGFGDSPCLQSYLTAQKDLIAKDLKQPLKLRFLPRNTSATGVATGAILRAIDKANGPSRIPCQSIGVLRHIPCHDEDDQYPREVFNQPKRWSHQEKQNYVMDTILWIVKKDGEMLDSLHTVTFLSEHVFQPNELEWVIEEQLWASETCVADFFKIDHPKNAGKIMKIGAVEFDISNMRQKIRSANRKAGEMVDKAVIFVELAVIDRNLEFTARWPPTPEGQVIKGSRKFFSVASAFIPGTQ
ncbi:hypothetical protein OPT61_g2702 [Boeremia exigua]|uniref:Uncharacterized protein n=1 Tax=Boeremia exigua TaxID=749465 RepID=A0ACC2IKK7_9PLEO|nr:hypothetical protein OPT61_g2702 [Boeremia exigua]